MVAALAFACVLVTLIGTGSKASAEAFGCQLNHITVNSQSGNDSPECLTGNSSSYTPCETLGYALSDSSFLDCSEITVEGHHQIHHTLTVSGVDRLTMKGGGNTVYCSHKEDERSGIVFESVSSLKVLNITFDGCGTLQYGTDSASIKHRSAVHVFNSSNVQFCYASFHGSVGRGLSMHNVDGHVEVSYSNFVDNALPAAASETVGESDGGGLYIQFPSCLTETRYCDRDTNKESSKYLIQNCLFKSNRATNNEQFRVLPQTNTGRGGGIYFVITNSITNASVVIKNCTFYNNSAQYGGGIYAVFLGTVHKSMISIQRCNFTGNRANGGGGGALQMGGNTGKEMTRNAISVLNSHFVHNSAFQGGGMAFFSPISNTDTSRKLELTNCTWTGNFAVIGAAIFLTSSRGSEFDRVFPIAVIHTCSFSRNKLVAKSSTDSFLEPWSFSGVIDIRLFELHISGHTLFQHNRASPITATATVVHILQKTVADFVSNTAAYGGGMTLLGYSVIYLYPGSQVLFESNRASELGGAVYTPLPYLTSIIYPPDCFISHRFGNYSDEQAPLVSFTNNTAKYGHSIFTTSLHPCQKQIRGIGSNATSSFQWNGLHFPPDFKEHTITTSPDVVKFTLPSEIAPGERIDLKLVSLDELKQPILSAYKVTIAVNGEGQVQTNPYISENGSLQIWGRPGTEFNLTLRTLNERSVSATGTGRLGNCPLGLSLMGDECVCSASTHDRAIVGVEECDMSSFKAYLQTGYWLGCTTSGVVMTSYCPPHYCNYHDMSSHHGREVPRSCDSLEESRLQCIEHRRGRACGECEDGYSVYFHSEHFDCGRCPYGALGLLFYALSELVPLLLLFAVVMITKFKITSGLMQSLLLFKQTVSFINLTPVLTPSSRAGDTLVRIHTFLLGFLNLDFFRLDEISFCLWSGATTLDNLAFHYVTITFAMLFLAVFIFVLKKNPSFPVKLCRKFKKVEERLRFHKKPIVHSISTVLILSYTKYTVVSLQILGHLRVYGEGKQQIGTVVRLQGNLERFGVEHLPHAIPALAVLAFLSLPPPLLLISYPLLWNIRAKLRQSLGKNGDDITPWPIRKLLPLIDSFQGVFKDNRRMFAGLLFLWRIVLATIFACSPSHTSFFFLTEVALVVIFTVHVLARPYKRRLYNVIDSAMLANMALINLLSWHISIASWGDEGLAYLEAEIAIKLLLMYAPLVVVGFFAVIWLLRKFKVLPEELRWQRTQEEQSLPTHLSSLATKRGGTCTDEDLFSRSAEHNTSSYVLTSSEMGFELKERSTRENTVATKDSDAIAE